MIPSSITEISSYAFTDCQNIYDIFIPKNVKLIGNFSFYNCKKLKKIEFEDGSMINSIGYGSFGYSLIKSFIIPKSFVIFDLNAFESAMELLSIEFLSDEITCENFLCLNKLLVVSFPNAKKICIENDSFMVFSESFRLFTCPNIKISY